MPVYDLWSWCGEGIDVSTFLSFQYANHLRTVRGFADSTIGHHRYSGKRFLDHLSARKISVGAIQPKNVETYVKQTGRRLSRASLQHEIAAVRGFLRFLATEGKTCPGLDRQIDTPRLYRLEQLPRAISPPFAPPISPSGATAPKRHIPHQATNDAAALETARIRAMIRWRHETSTIGAFETGESELCLMLGKNPSPAASGGDYRGSPISEAWY